MKPIKIGNSIKIIYASLADKTMCKIDDFDEFYLAILITNGRIKLNGEFDCIDIDGAYEIIEKYKAIRE